jgi:hypothetical protein
MAANSRITFKPVALRTPSHIQQSQSVRVIIQTADQQRLLHGMTLQSNTGLEEKQNCNQTHFEAEGLALVHTAYRIHLSVQLLEPVHRHWTTLEIRAGTVETGVQENLGDEHRPPLGLPLCCSMTCRCCVSAIIQQ